jgi:hypothetical protein
MFAKRAQFWNMYHLGTYHSLLRQLCGAETKAPQIGGGSEARPKQRVQAALPTEQLLSDKTLGRFIAHVTSLLE